MNGDGNYSDLIYVPNSQDEMTFVDITDKSGAITYSAVDQAKDFWDFVNNDSYLKDRKGKYGIQVSLDMLNVGNMINSKWGAYQSCGLKSYDNVQLLKTASKVGEPLTYQINANSREAFKERSSWQYTNTIGSAWSMQLGVKVTF